MKHTKNRTKGSQKIHTHTHTHHVAESDGHDGDQTGKKRLELAQSFGVNMLIHNMLRSCTETIQDHVIHEVLSMKRKLHKEEIMHSYIPYCSSSRKRKVSTAVIMAPWYNSILPFDSTLMAIADPNTS